MRIQLNRNYSSLLIEDLPAGEYDEHDERLKGRAEYLVGIEVAAWVGEDEAAPEGDDETEAVQAIRTAKKKGGKK